MSFLKGGAGASGAASGLGGLIGVDPSRISSIANGIGTAANGIAAAGGAAQGYQAPNNYMQYADPNSLQAILAKFGNTNMPVNVTNQMPPPRYAGMGIPEYAR